VTSFRPIQKMWSWGKQHDDSEKTWIRLQKEENELVTSLLARNKRLEEENKGLKEQLDKYRGGNKETSHHVHELTSKNILNIGCINASSVPLEVIAIIQNAIANLIECEVQFGSYDHISKVPTMVKNVLFIYRLPSREGVLLDEFTPILNELTARSGTILLFLKHTPEDNFQSKVMHFANLKTFFMTYFEATTPIMKMTGQNEQELKALSILMKS